MSTYESLGSNLDNEGSLTASSSSEKNWQFFTGVLCSCFEPLNSKTVLKSLLLGQGLSILLSGTGVFTGLLQEQDVNIPTAQNFLLYCLLCLIFTTYIAYKGGARSITTILQQDGWKYALLAVIDVEANFLITKAYGYTTVTSVQVLDCFSIAAVLILSRVFLRVKYRVVHYVGVSISVIGLAGLITADSISGKNGDTDNGGKNAAIGDLLVVAGAILYGFSNVGMEFVVKNYNKSEFLGMLGLFGSFVSGIQVILVESDEINKLDFTSYKVYLPLCGFVIFMLLIYTCMSYVIGETSATLTNISILSADFYSLIFGLVIFNYSFHFLYFIAFLVVIIGVAVYSTRPTSSLLPTSSVNNASSIT